MKFSNTRRLLLAGSLIMILGGCGGGDSESGAGSDAATPEADPTLAKVYRGPVRMEERSAVDPFKKEYTTVQMTVTVNSNGTVDVDHDGIGYDGRANGNSFSVVERSSGTSKLGSTTINTSRDFRVSGQIRDDRVTGNVVDNSKYILTFYREGNFNLPRVM